MKKFWLILNCILIMQACTENPLEESQKDSSLKIQEQIANHKSFGELMSLRFEEGRKLRKSSKSLPQARIEIRDKTGADAKYAELDSYILARGYKSRDEFHNFMQKKMKCIKEIEESFIIFQKYDPYQKASLLREAEKTYIIHSLEMQGDDEETVDDWLCSVLARACKEACDEWDNSFSCYVSCYFVYLNCLAGGF